MELAFNPAMFLNLSKDEEQAIVGGINWGSIGAGLGILSAVCISVACAPASAFVGAAYVALSIGAYSGAAAAGVYIGFGITEW